MNTIKIEGTTYTSDDFREKEGETPTFLGSESKRSSVHSASIDRKLYSFLREWFSDAQTIRLHTSGSTGTPKEITVQKVHMIQSAKITCDFFGLKKNDKALLCLPLDYIAGKMMVVRAIYAGLDIYLIEPEGHPLIETDIPFDFAAMIPLQVYNSLQTVKEKHQLSCIKKLIIGGGAIDENLEKALRDFPNEIYSTYGMTETVSHIALRRISGSGASLYYTPLPSVTLTLSEERTLVIDAPHLSDKVLITNDIAELRPNGSFRLIGRTDNIINSGGIKIQIEEIEQILRPHILGDFAITSLPHPKLGETVVLLIENTSDPISVEKTVRTLLSRYQQPMYIYTVLSIPKTGNGKTDRMATQQLAKKLNQLSPTVRYIH